MTRSAEPRVLQFCHGYDGPFLDCARQYASLFAGTPYKVTTVFLTGRSDPEVAARCASDEVLFLEYGSRDIRGLKLKAIRDLREIARSRDFRFCIAHRFKPIWIASLVLVRMQAADVADHPGLVGQAQLPARTQALDLLGLQRSDVDAVVERLDPLPRPLRQATAGVALNTSLNRRGEPMICSPTDALNMFFGSDLQYLIMEDILVVKEGVDWYDSVG